MKKQTAKSVKMKPCPFNIYLVDGKHEPLLNLWQDNNVAQIHVSKMNFEAITGQRINGHGVFKIVKVVNRASGGKRKA